MKINGRGCAEGTISYFANNSPLILYSLIIPYPLIFFSLCMYNVISIPH